MSGGGGGFDPGKELAQLDKDLSLSQNAPLIAAATALYLSGGTVGAETLSTMGAEASSAVPLAGTGVAAGEAAGIADLATAAAPAATAASPAAAASAVPVATEVAGAGAGAGAAPVATAANPYAAMGAEPGVGGTPWAATNAAAPAQSDISGLWESTKALASEYPKTAIGLGLGAAAMYADRNKGGVPTQAPYDGPLNKLRYDPDRYHPLEVKPPTPYTPVYKDYRSMAGGGLATFGRDIERFIQEQQQAKYATPPLSYDPARYNPDIGTKMVARPGMAGGGIADLGGYSDGGRMLKGPGDGMSDSIPATIANKQPARLANDEFVVPADVVSHLGNGSSDAGAKQLYKMMDKVRSARTGKKSQAKQINPAKYMPA